MDCPMRASLLPGLVVLLLLSACGGSPPPAPRPVSPLGSRVDLAAGEVWLETDGRAQRLVTGAMLPENAVISLREGARALIRLGDGTGVFLRGGTKIEVGEEGVELVDGELWAEVPMDEEEMGRFTASDVVVTASGASFDLARDDGAVTVYVARGLAVVASTGGREEVRNGERATVKGGAKPSVEPVGFWDDWTGGMADRELMAGEGGKGTGRIYGIDRTNPGSPPKELHVLSQEITTVIRDGVAHTTVDQRFFNPASMDVEGWYWFTVPDGAAVERFAMEVNGYFVEGEMTERGQAAQAYEEAIQRAFDPALLEWVDGRTFRARIFPIPAAGERRVVLSYTELLPLADGAFRYVYPMGGAQESRIQEFSLRVVLGDEGKDYEIAASQGARVEDDFSMVSMRRSGFIPRSDFLLELKPVEKAKPLRVARFSTGGREADYVMIRYSPEVDWAKVERIPGDVVIVVDTSAGGGETERRVRSDVAEAILRALAAGDRFALVATDLAPRVIFPAQGLAPADGENVSKAIEALSGVSSAGATDLGEMFSVALQLVHEAEQPAVVYVGDGRPTVGETTSVELSERLRRSLGDSRARLFTIAVGAEANLSLLERLSRMGGGRSFRVDTPEQTVQEALRFAGMVKTPTITDLEIDVGAGLDQEFSTVAKKVSEGEEVVILARTHHELPKVVRVEGRLGGKPFERSYQTEVSGGDDFGYVPSLWARMYLERLMGEGRAENRGSIISLGLTYALMTPFTSFLVLESDQAYFEAGIQRRQRSNRWQGFGVEAARGAPSIGTASGSVVTATESAEPEMEMAVEESAGDYWRDESGYYRADKSAAKKAEAPAPSVAQPPATPPPMPAPAASPSFPQGSGFVGGLAAPGSAQAAGARRSTASAGAGGYAVDGLIGARSSGGEAVKDRPSSSATRTKAKRPIADGDDAERISPDELLARAVVSTPVPAAESGALFAQGVCSDASRRPMAQRRLIWNLRLARATTPAELARAFFDAGEQCELPRWEQRKELLEMIERRVSTAEEVRGLLDLFAPHPKVQRFLRQRVLRRTLDPDLVHSLYEPSNIDWYTVRRALAAIDKPADRLAKLRKILENNPEDPVGRAMLVEALLDDDQTEEARAVAARLRRDELAGPMVLAVLCDLQSEVGLEDEARRTCSELVEFNEGDPAARARLGDLFLRHGWYGAAYRQYNTLVEMVDDDPIAWLKLAAAAAGMGRVDEALRIERKVASGDGETGPADPRRWARLHSVARLARMIMEARANGDEAQIEVLERNLKRVFTFTDPATMVILLWEDLEVPMDLVARRGDKPFALFDRVVSRDTGLVMIDLGRKAPTDVALEVEVDSVPVRRAIGFSMVTIGWDGERFTFAEKDGSLAPRARTVAVAK